MPTIVGVKTVQPTPAIIVTTNVGAPSYESIRRALGPNVMHAFQLYLGSTSAAQIQAVFGFNKYEATGNAETHFLTPVFSPYQYQNTIFYEMRDRPVLIDGLNSFAFTMLAGAKMQFKLYSVETNVGQILEASDFPTINNFRQAETATGLFGFFEQFKKNIPLTDPQGPEMEPSQMNFTITNTTTANIPMSFLGNMANMADISNQFTEYSFNISGFSFGGITSVSIVYQRTGFSGNTYTATAGVNDPSLQGVLAALNSLNLSQWFNQTVGPNMFIKTYNDLTEFLTMVLS